MPLNIKGTDLSVLAKQHKTLLILGTITALAAAILNIVGSIKNVAIYSIVGNIFWLLEVVVGAVVTAYYIFCKTPTNTPESSTIQPSTLDIEALAVEVPERKGVDLNRQLGGFGGSLRIGGIEYSPRLGVGEWGGAERLSTASWLEFA